MGHAQPGHRRRVVAALLAGVPAIPLNPRSGPRELEHVVADVEPDAVLAAPGADLPEPLSTVPLLPSRGREVRFVAELPRNDLGKLVKARLPR